MTLPARGRTWSINLQLELRLGLETDGSSLQAEVGEKAGCDGTVLGTHSNRQTLGIKLAAEITTKYIFLLPLI